MRIPPSILARLRALAPDKRPASIRRAIAALKAGEEVAPGTSEAEMRYAERLVSFIAAARLSDVGEGEEPELL